MIVLLETPAGFALFKVKNLAKLTQVDNLYEHFQNTANADKA
jgi:nucleolar protein 58